MNLLAREPLVYGFGIVVFPVETGNRLATLPAANFSGSGDALVTGMTKGELTSAAKQQEAAPAPSAQTESSTPTATKSGGNRSREANNNKER